MFLRVAQRFDCLVSFMINVSAGSGLCRREEVTCHPETRDHRCDKRSGRCHGDHGSSARCQILLGQRQPTRHGIFAMSIIFLHRIILESTKVIAYRVYLNLIDVTVTSMQLQYALRKCLIDRYYPAAPNRRGIKL